MYRIQTSSSLTLGLNSESANYSASCVTLSNFLPLSKSQPPKPAPRQEKLDHSTGHGAWRPSFIPLLQRAQHIYNVSLLFSTLGVTLGMTKEHIWHVSSQHNTVHTYTHVPNSFRGQKQNSKKSPMSEQWKYSSSFLRRDETKQGQKRIQAVFLISHTQVLSDTRTDFLQMLKILHK